MRLYTLITFIQQILNDVKTSIHIYIDSRLIFLGKLIKCFRCPTVHTQCIIIPYFSWLQLPEKSEKIDPYLIIAYIVLCLIVQPLQS